MEGFICSNCGSNMFCDLNGKEIENAKSIDVRGKYVCGECGTEIEKAQIGALVVQAANKSTATNNIKAQARNAYNNGNYEAALNYYQQIGAIDPMSWEAAFYPVCCNSRMSAAVENACEAVRLCLDGVFDKIDLLQGEEKRVAVKLLVSDACLFAVNMFDAAVKQHMAIPASAMSQHNNELKRQLVSAANIMIICSSNVMNRYGDEAAVAALVEIPATAAIQLQTRQSFVSMNYEPDTSRTLLEWIGRYNPTFVEDYKKKQNRSMTTGNVFLMILGAIFLVIGLMMEGTFAKWFCIPMAAFCLLWGLFRIIVQVANKKLNG